MRPAFAAALAILVGSAAIGLRGRPAPGETSVNRWLEQHAPGEIHEPQPGIPLPARLDYSLLWLEAMGVGHLVSANAAKYGGALEKEVCDPSVTCVYLGPARRATPAVIVSRRLWRALPPLRSLYHRAALEAYIEWADRMEAAGFRRSGPGAAEVRADLDPDDMILVRQPARRWSAMLDGRSLECLRDPIGYLVLDPGRTGWVTIRLTAKEPAGPPDPPLGRQIIPTITGVAEAMRGTPPPFAPGTLIAIYGADLNAGGATRVLLGGARVRVFYAGEQQVNAQVPELPAGPAELVVETGGVASDPVTVEIAAR